MVYLYGKERNQTMVTIIKIILFIIFFINSYRSTKNDSSNRYDNPWGADID